MGPKRSRVGRCRAWQFMPAELLAKILSYLPQKERLQARLTCRQWNNVCLQPQFWRQRNICFTDDQSKKLKNSIFEYMKAFGSSLRQLTITLNITRRLKTKALSTKMYSDLQELLKHIPLDLQKFMMREFWGLKKLRDGSYEREFLTSLSSMLERQERLFVVGFCNSKLGEEDGLRLLNSIPTTVTTIILKRFFFDDFSVNHCPRFVKLLDRFKGLESLGMSYRYLSTDVLDTLISTSPLFNRLVLNLDELQDGDLYQKALRYKTDWKLVVRKRPELRVWTTNTHGLDVLWYCKYDGQSVSSFFFTLQELFLPEIPLVGVRLDLSSTQINYQGYGDITVEERITNVTKCISGNCLNVNTFVLTPPSSRDPWKCSKALVDLVTTVPSLTHLCLQLPVTMETVLVVAAAALPHSQGPLEEEAAGSSATYATSPTPSLHIHIAGCDVPLDTVRERLAGVNPFCRVEICERCTACNQFIA